MGETLSTLTYLLPKQCNRCEGTGYEPRDQSTTSSYCKVCSGYKYIRRIKNTPTYNTDCFDNNPPPIC